MPILIAINDMLQYFLKISQSFKIVNDIKNLRIVFLFFIFATDISYRYYAEYVYIHVLAKYSVLALYNFMAT